jgi:hypothetical protein
MILFEGCFVIDAERDIKLTVRVSLQERTALRQRAFKAGLPVAVFMRTSALSGAPVVPMPPAPADLPDPCKKLLNVAHACISNFTQLHAHALASGTPLDRVCPLLTEMQNKVRELGMAVKSGGIDEVRATSILEVDLLAASDLLNALAQSLNEGQIPTHQAWHAALSSMRTALEQIK